MRGPLSLTLLLAMAVPVSAFAQEADGPSLDDGPTGEPGSTIVVTGNRLRGSLDVPQAPVAELEEADIAAYGADSIADLVEQLAPQTGSGRGRGGGRPVFLVNGQRISSFREFRRYPSEAIRKVEIFPEETALRYGFPPDQRVINFILKENFSSREIEVEYGFPTSGGYDYNEIEGSWLNIAGPRRLNFNLEYNDTGLLTEAQRDIEQSGLPIAVGDPDPAAFRSLVDNASNLEGEASISSGIGENDGTWSLSASASRAESSGLSGLDTVLLDDGSSTGLLRALDGDPLRDDTRTNTYGLAGSVNYRLGDWDTTATFDAQRNDTRREIDRRRDGSVIAELVADGLLAATGPLPTIADAGHDVANTQADNVSTKVTAIGRPLLLPAGEVTATFDLGLGYERIESRDTRSETGRTELSRRDLGGGFNIGVPIASRRDDFLSAIGDLSLNLSAGVNDLSDFGVLSDYTVGATWSPIEDLSLQASYIHAEAAPAINQLGGATTTRFNVAQFDFTTGQTVLVNVLSGPNPDLVKETQRDIKLSANYDLDLFDRTNIVVEYFRNRSDDVTASFPLLTPAIEDAFPDRVTRAADGTLVALDRRPITLAQQRSSRLRYGFSTFGKVGKAPEREAGGEGRGGRRGGGGSAMIPGRGGDGQGRWNASLFHTVNLDNTVLVADGVPVFDLLDGDALSGGGQPRHTVSLTGGLYKGGIGFRLSADYSGKTRLDGTGLPGSTDLFFDDFAKLDARLFMNLEEQKWLVGDDPGAFKGARLSLRIDNVFDGRQRVTDGTGAVPLRYQPDLIDPIGRYIEIDFRKMF